jgi:glycosyltransferase involved in cell wall biosynthesis
MRIAFHAPLKSPDHPVPSGDRLMARLLIEAMRLAGHTVFVASQFRSYAASPEEFAQRRSAGEAAAAELAARWRDATPPELFFCYHPYYKAPDFLGPRLSATFGIPYVTAEASLSSRRRIGPWAAAQEVVEHGLRHASLNLCFTRRDFEGLLGVVGKDRLAMIPPFIDTSAFAIPASGAMPPRLITVAMMRAGDKLESYRTLAAALGGCQDLPWRLTIVGEGPCRHEVRSLFSRLPSGRVVWLGERSPEEVPGILAGGSIYVWPGTGEAYGLAYLEAQAAGLPVVAQAAAGVPEVVRDGATGLLTPPGDIPAYAAAVRRLLSDRALRCEMGVEARRFVLAERSLSTASAVLATCLRKFAA